MASPLKLGVLLSGGGTTLENLIAEIKGGTLDATVSVVVSSSPKAFGLVRAAKHDIPSRTIRLADYPDNGAFSEAISHVLRDNGVELVILAGFLKLYTIPDDYRGRVMNIHPALIPKFCGKGFYGHHVHEAVLAAGEKESGCTVHYCDNEYDHGPIILQRTVPVLDDDTPDTLAKRVFAEERKAYPEAIRRFIAEKK